MKIITKQAISLLLSVVLLLSAVVLPVSAEDVPDGPQPVLRSVKRQDINFNADWKFNLGSSGSAQNKEFSDSSWKTVSIPHDFSISQNFTTTGGTEVESGYLPGGTGWYRKHFTVREADAGKTFVLNFDGAYKDTYVYVNGSYVGENHYGYNSFSFDISEHLVCDGETDNVIAVKVDHQLPSSRWYSGSGIYRDVTLTVTSPVHVATNGTHITTPNLESQRNGTVGVNVTTEIANDSDTTEEIILCSTVLNANGRAVSDTVANAVTLNAQSGTSLSASLYVNSPELWSPSSPALYILKSEVSIDNRIVDTYYTEFGFRYFRFDANNGFYLNGNALKLKGVCMHHDQGALGAAAYDDAMERQLQMLKDMGVNAIRTSHNIADKDFIRMCNEMGFLVMEEAFDGWSAAKNSNSHDFSEYFNQTISSSNGIIDGHSGQTWAEFVLKSMVLRDRNDPCIFMWDIGNEITNIINNGNTSQYPTYTSNMISWIKSLDTTRPITHGDNNGKVTTSSSHVTAKVDRLIAESGGVVGFNYYVDEMATTHKSYPNWKLIATETVSSINSRGAYSRYQSSGSLYQSSKGPYLGNAYDNYCVFWGTTAHDGWYDVIRNDYISGEFCWTGFDYIGEPTPWWRTTATSGGFTSLGAAPNSSYFGAIDTAGFPKDKYYFYRSQWNNSSTTLHLVTAWDADNQYVSNSRTPVWIYTNAPKVELYRTDSKGNTVKLATATRTEHTTAMGHSYGTYSTTINNSTYCQKISTSGAAALSARFNVSYTAGSIYAVAYDKNGNEIQYTVGNSRVNTPGAAANINAYSNKSEIDADGYSLSYITLDVTDSSGNLDTAATNRIELSLSGDGEIVGVDNGDPATLRKYQQSSVLTGPKSANIDAYAGKALVIVRSTEKAGSFTLTASASGLSGDSVTVATRAVRKEIPVETVTLPVETLEMKVGETYELTAEVDPEDATEQTVEWITSDSELATVEDGVITALASGTVTITAAVEEVIAQCVVTIAEAAPVTEIVLNETAMNLEVGTTAALTATVAPEEAAEAVLTWTSSDEAVATVAEGLVTAVAPGTATITVSSGEISAACVVTVSEAAAPVTGIQLSQTALTLSANETATLTAVITPAEASAVLTWRSSDETVATVSEGVIFGVAPGVATVTVSAGEVTAECIVTVEAAAAQETLIVLDRTEVSLNVAETAALTATVTPEGAAEVIWTSSDEAVATVAGGVVTAVEPGTAVVTAAAGEASAQCTVTVAAPVIEVEGVTLNHTQLTLLPGEMEVLTAAIRPEGATGNEEWSSSDPAVAIVEDGTITAVSEGCCYITVIVGNHGASCEVTVELPSLEPEKVAPKVTVEISFANSKTTITGQSDIAVNPDPYYPEVKHGVVYIVNSKLGSRNLMVSTSGATNKTISDYEEDGTFSYTFKPMSSSMSYAYRAYVYYEKPDGSRVYAYSPIVRGSGRSFG